ncbi:hypothetical protein P152DRAFT_460153 [Eremomyces bilateralis CBS 781.70]|uniref:Uncharacterized protein n=1 Tax=Eremomyces bilateralis CBS 781.70 TaxID=1392243 RepID=A0A6G1FYL3_9PEZI|nr:uncharacterized protein P152DRAFT_460153 [Eremomyces bilateralis CBS 781.70]KAF1810858.1 hypothetical protein P152DRAFT_460153 [Eremomyces bilateralis CBS 781.70]
MVVAVQASFRCRLRAFCKHFGGRIGEKSGFGPYGTLNSTKISDRGRPQKLISIYFLIYYKRVGSFTLYLASRKLLSTES